MDYKVKFARWFMVVGNAVIPERKDSQEQERLEDLRNKNKKRINKIFFSPIMSIFYFGKNGKFLFTTHTQERTTKCIEVGIFM